MRRFVLVLAAIVLALGGCDAGEWVGGSPEDAERIADRFLDAVKAGDTDAAWALVYPPNRDLVFDDDRAGFEAIVARIDLTDVTWNTTGAWQHDGHFHVSLDLQPPTVDDALAVFVDASPGGPAEITVDIEPWWGDSGVLGR